MHSLASDQIRAPVTTQLSPGFIAENNVPCFRMVPRVKEVRVLTAPEPALPLRSSVLTLVEIRTGICRRLVWGFGTSELCFNS